jgi:adhesin/invasin
VVSGSAQTAVVNTNFASPLHAVVQDTFGNPAAGASVTFTVPSSGASATFAGSATVTTDAGGMAISPPLTANSTSGLFAVSASTSGAATAASFALGNVGATANQLAFVQQPTNTAAGATITPPVTVQLLDSFGNPAPTAGVAITLQENPLVAARVAARSFPPQSTNSLGIATFSSLSINQAGLYQLLATASGIVSANSNVFTISAGSPATILATRGLLQSTTILTAFSRPLQATVLDAFGNPVSGAVVNFSASASGASATLSSPSAVTDSSGHASVIAVANATAGSYTVTAGTAGVTGTAAFNLTNVAGAAAIVSFTTQPSRSAPYAPSPAAMESPRSLL